MSTEASFGDELAERLRKLIPQKYEVETKRSLLYAVSFNDDGNLHLGQNAAREPVRGGGTGFEQDFLIFERVADGATAIVPRVSVELKFRSMTTHDSIVYSEKARRIRAVYPFVRYGLILGRANHIPARTVRLGAEFDFMVALPGDISTRALTRVANQLKTELAVSRQMTAVLRGQRKITTLHRPLRYIA